MPVMASPGHTPYIREPEVINAPVMDPSTTPRTKEEEEAVRRALKDLREKKPLFPPPPGTDSIISPARLTVRLPGNAKLWVDDAFCPLTSEVRSFNTPKLQPGRQYYYTLRMEVERDGQTLSLSRRVFLTSGRAVSVDMNDLTTATVRR